MTVGVYGFYQKSKDRAVYVGSSHDVEKRLYKHVWALKRGSHPNRHLQNTWNKYGADDIQASQIEECLPDAIIEREQFWMNAMPAWPTCNVSTIAGNNALGIKHSPEARKKNSDAQRNRQPITEETRVKISAAGLGRKFTDEHRRKISEALLGHKVSDELREKLSAVNMGQRPTEETRRKLSEAQKRIWAQKKEKRDSE